MGLVGVECTSFLSLDPEAMQPGEDEDEDYVFDKWMEQARAHPDLTIDDPERECPLFMTDMPDHPANIDKNPGVGS